jgi:hypothetical protein
MVHPRPAAILWCRVSAGFAVVLGWRVSFGVVTAETLSGQRAFRLLKRAIPKAARKSPS